MTTSPQTCLCGSGQTYPDCCARLHNGAQAIDAEALMRSRYSAYALGLKDYLLATWHPDTRPARLKVGPGAGPKWLGLEVIRHQVTGSEQAVVEFVAHCKSFGFTRRLHETSRFLRVDNRWLYVDGDCR